MLSEEKKSLIAAEERYRHEIGRKLRAGLNATEGELEVIENSLWAKVNEILNSNVGMWFLSTVLVTGGAGVYQATQHHYEVKLRNRTQLMVNQFEIGNRIQNLKYFIRKAKTIGDAQIALKSVFLSKTPVNPEVEKLSLSVIYFNFYQIVGTQNKEALELVRKLEDQEYSFQSLKPTDPLPEEAREKLLKWIGELEAIQVQEASKKH